MNFKVICYSIQRSAKVQKIFQMIEHISPNQSEYPPPLPSSKYKSAERGGKSRY